MSGGSSRRYPPELRERAVRIVAEISDHHDSEWGAISEVARLLGVGCAETVRKWVRRHRPGQGLPTSPLSPTPRLAGFWVGGSLPRWPPRWSSMRSSRPSGPVNKRVLDLKDVVRHTDRGSQPGFGGRCNTACLD
jgi:transposase